MENLPTRFKGPIWTLLFLAPFIAEVLSGSTRLSYLFVFLPEVMVWGVGALLCREFVRRWKAGSVSLVFLGLALSVAEEFIIQQTSLAPLPWPGVNAGYGRVWGVNWIYFLFMLGFESVWVIVVPVQVTELFFPHRAREPWLRMRSIIGCCIVFVLGCFMAWYGWTQQARPRLHAAPYQPPLPAIAAGVAIICLLIVLAYLLRNVVASSSAAATAPAWIAGPLAFGMAAPWFLLMSVVFSPNPRMRFAVLLGLGLAWALIAGWLYLHWSRSARWTSIHTWAACCGVILAGMAAPYLSIRSWLPVDVIANVLFDVIAVAGLAMLGTAVARRANSVDV